MIRIVEINKGLLALMDGETMLANVPRKHAAFAEMVARLVNNAPYLISYWQDCSNRDIDPDFSILDQYISNL